MLEQFSEEHIIREMNAGRDGSIDELIISGMSDLESSLYFFDSSFP